MTTVHGQIESLKRIKETLAEEGIDRFSSIQDIKKFKSTFEIEKEEIQSKAKVDYALELEALHVKANALESAYKDCYATKTNAHDLRIENYIAKKEDLEAAEKTNLFVAAYLWVYQMLLSVFIWYYDTTFQMRVESETRQPQNAMTTAKAQYEWFKANKGTLLNDRILPQLQELRRITRVIEKLQPTIKGAIGENLVQKELKKLSGNNYLINDFSLEFETPLYNRKEDDYICSIQVDHLLVTPAGIFNLETKNWNKNTVQRVDMRSPIAQVKRTGFALYVVLNGRMKQHMQLSEHHWGELKIPIRNVVVVTNAMPHAKFRDAGVKNLSELNNYIHWFDPLFDAVEVKRIAEQLKRMKFDGELTV